MQLADFHETDQKMNYESMNHTCLLLKVQAVLLVVVSLWQINVWITLDPQYQLNIAVFLNTVALLRIQPLSDRNVQHDNIPSSQENSRNITMFVRCELVKCHVLDLSLQTC